MKSMNKLARRGLTVTLAAATVLGMTVAPAAPVLSTAVSAFAAVTPATQAKSIQTGQTTNITLPTNTTNDANITKYVISAADDAAAKTVNETVSVGTLGDVTKDGVSFTDNKALVVTAKKAGTATFTIKAYANGDEVGATTYTINVGNRANDTTFTVGNTTVGDTFQAAKGQTYTLTKKGAANGKISVYSTNPKVIDNAQADADGNITFNPKATGTAALIITQEGNTDYTGTTKTVTVNVGETATTSANATVAYTSQGENVTVDTSKADYQKSIKNIYLDKTTVKEAQLTVTPATGTTVTYNSDGAVQVTNTGKVTATGAGNVIITLTSSTGDTKKVTIPVNYAETEQKYFTAKDSKGNTVNETAPVTLSTQDKTSDTITTTTNENGDYADAVKVTDAKNAATTDIAYSNGTVSVKNTALKGDNTYYVVFHYRNDDATYKVKVTVTDQKLSNSITTSADSVKVDIAHPTATVTATDANNKGVTYSIVKFTDGKEDTKTPASVATTTAAATCDYFTVTNNGLVTYKADMPATGDQYVIKVTADNATPKYITVASKGTQDNAFTITDAKGAAVKDNVSLTLGKDATYTVKANDVAAKDTKVAVSNEAVATAKVDEATGNVVITPVAEGTTLVTVSGTVGATSNYANPAPVTFAVTVKPETKAVKAPAKVTGVKVTNKKGQKLNVSYKKVKGAAGYLIKYTTNGKTYKVRTVKTSKNVTKGIKKGKKVSVKVRAYKTSGTKNIYGAYSKTVNKTVDKK